MADVELKTKLTLGGDAEYKKALRGINDELKIAKSGMAAATSAFAKNDDSAQALQTRYDELGKVFSKQKEKVNLIQDELEKLSNAEGDNEEDVKKLQIALNNAIAQMNKTQLQMDQLADSTEDESDASEEAAENTESFGDKLKSAGVAAGKATFSAVAASIAAVGAAAAAAVKELYGFTQGAGTYVDDINTLSVQTGIATDTLQKWRYAESLIDVSTDTMTGAMRKMTKYMGDAKDGSKSATEKFEALGLSIYDSSGNMKDSETLFYEAIDALGKVSNETERDALAMDLFGQSAQELNPLIESGTGALKKLGEEAENTGFVLSDSMMQAAQDYQDAQDRMTNASTALKNTLGAALAPAMTEVTKRATHMMQKVTTALSDGIQPGEIEELSTQLQAEFGGMIGSILKKLEKAMPLFTDLLTTLVDTIVEHMPKLIEKLIPAAESLLQTVLDTLIAEAGPIANLASDILVTLATFITENLPSLVTAAADVLTSFIDGITDSLPELIPLAVNMIVNLALALVDAIPKLTEKLPEIVNAIITGLQNVDWLEVGTNLITGLKDGLWNAAVAGLNAITSIFDSIWTAVLHCFGIGRKEGDASSELAEGAAGNILDGLIGGFTNGVNLVIETVKTIFGKIWDAIKSIFGFGSRDKEAKETKNEASTAGENIMDGMSSGITGNEEKVKKAGTEAAKGTITSMKNALDVKSGKSTKGEELGKYFALGMESGISSNSRKISDAAVKAAKAAYKAAKNELGIKSPSRVMMEVGGYYDEGFALGISKNAEKVYDAAQSLARESAMPTTGRTAAIAGAAASAASAGGVVNNYSTTYSGPFTANDAGVFGQTLARSLSGMVAVMG